MATVLWKPFVFISDTEITLLPDVSVQGDPYNNSTTRRIL